MPKVLVVEDDKSMNKILVRTLLDEGHEVQTTFNGKDAVTLCKTEKFELVITDIRMPGIDGVEGLRQIKEIQPNVSCIVITGYSNADAPMRAIKLEVDEYLVKPFRLKTFHKTISRALDPEGEVAKRRLLLWKLLSLIPDLKNREISRLKQARLQVFRGLYIGVRSGFLSRNAASEVYATLETLEVDYRRLEASSSSEAKAIRHLSMRYWAVLDRQGAFYQGQADDDAYDMVDDIPHDQMSTLLAAIKSSEVGLDDLQYAPFLRTIPNSQLELFEAFQEIKGRLWPSLMVHSG